MGSREYLRYRRVAIERGHALLLTAALLSGSATAQEVSVTQALQSALENNQGIRTSHTSIDIAKSHVLREAGVFDAQYNITGSILRNYQPLTDYEHSLALAAGIDTFKQAQNVEDIHADEQKLFRFGGRLSAAFDTQRLDDNLENLGGVNRTNLNVNLTIPLLRGRGTAFTTAGERAARLDLEGSVHEWNAGTAAMLMSAAEHYFAMAAAQKTLELMQAAKSNADSTLDEVQQLIRADKLASASISDASAQVERQQLRVIDARSALFHARAVLAQDMGLDLLTAQSLRAVPNALTPPGDPIPAPDLAILVSNSITLRSEVLGEKKHIDAAREQRDAAAAGLKQQLDVGITSGYTGLTLGTGPIDYVDSIGNRIGGANVVGSITYHFDHGNAAARSSVDAANAQLDRARSAETELETRIRLEVLDSQNDLQIARESLATTTHLQDALQQVADAKQERMRAGAGPLSDVLTAQSQWIDAQIASVEAQRKYAVAVARAHYATGTLLGSDPAHPQLDRSTFYSEQIPGPKSKERVNP